MIDLTKIEEKEFYNAFGFEYEKGSVIETLLLNCCLPEIITDLIWQRLFNGLFTDEEADEVIHYLKDNQLDRIEAGFNYSQTDIKRKLKWNKS